MSRILPAFVFAVLGLTGLAATCSTQPPQIARERAITIAPLQSCS